MRVRRVGRRSELASAGPGRVRRGEARRGERLRGVRVGLHRAPTTSPLVKSSPRPLTKASCVPGCPVWVPRRVHSRHPICLRVPPLFSRAPRSRGSVVNVSFQTVNYFLGGTPLVCHGNPPHASAGCPFHDPSNAAEHISISVKRRLVLCVTRRTYVGDPQ